MRGLTSIAIGAAWLVAAAGAAEAGEAAGDYSLEGTAALSGCSGAVFHFDGQPMDAEALVLTNGHCIGTMGEYEVLVGVPVNREVIFYDDAQAMTSEYRATEIVYATMHRTDMAVLRVDATYQELADAGVRSLRLASQRPTGDEAIAVASGLWEYVTECQLDGFVHTMKESRWTWTDSLRYTADCVTFGGTSGSPVISTASGDIIGVNNTGYEGGEPCSFNNPCEVDENGDVTTVTGGSYGQQTYTLYSCIDGAFGIDLLRGDCALPRPRGVLRVAGIALASDQECDADGNLDPGETAVVEVTLYNEGPVELVSTSLVVTANSDAVDIPAATVQVDSIAGFESVTIDVPITLDAGARDITAIAFDVVASDPDSAAPEATASSEHRVNYDDVPNSSSTDDVESNAVPWTTRTIGDELDDGVGWARVRDDDANTAWYARDVGAEGDQRLESPDLEVGDGAFVVRFSHRYAFETSRDTFWDGGVVEVSTDGGATWTDASDFADVAYGGTLTDESGNPLGNRAAFVDTSPAWPERSDAVIDFGTALANETVRIRFRVGTDRAAGDFGWEIDDIAVDGIDNLPFSTIDELANSCDPTPPDDGGDPPDDPAPPESDGGCAAGGTQGPAWLPLLLVALVIRRRRRCATIGG